MFNRIIRYFRGYLRISISGNAVERFINTCSYKNICLWNLSSHQSKYEMNIMIQDFKKLKPVIRKTRTKVVIVDRTGFPFFLQKYGRRRLFFAGFFLCITIVYLLSTFIWGINIDGNLSYTNETLIDFLETIDVKKGMKQNNVDCWKIAREIRNNYNEIIWVSASVEGSRLNIQIKENEDSKDLNNIPNNSFQDAYDIVADRDCQITKIIIRNGIIQAKTGESVTAGDILVSGQIPVLNDAKEIVNYQYCISDADIYGIVNISYEDEISHTYYEKNFYGIEKQEYYLRIGKHRFTLGGIQNNYSSFTEQSRQKIICGCIVGRRSVFPYKSVKKQYSNDEIREILSQNFQYHCKELKKKGVVILQNDVKIYTWSDKAKAIGKITVEMPVGKLKKSELIEIGETIDGNDGNNN